TQTTEALKIPMSHNPTHYCCRSSTDRECQCQSPTQFLILVAPPAEHLVATPSEASPQFSGSSQLGYPSRKALQGLACQLINQQKRGANLAVNPGINPSTFCPESPSPHPSSLNQPTIRSVSPLWVNPQTVPSNVPVTSSQSHDTTQSSITDSESHDAQDRPETETWIGQVPGVLYCSLIVNGQIVLTYPRLCYLAYLPTFDKGQIIHSGPATVKADSRFSKRRRRWVELRTEYVDHFSSAFLTRP
ncbi:hypothetical protein VP01_6494g1, partial [Puccinia sorghi]